MRAGLGSSDMAVNAGVLVGPDTGTPNQDPRIWLIFGMFLVGFSLLMRCLL